MTISKTNYILISITMVVVLLLFQFTNVSIRLTSKATTNPHAQNSSSLKLSDIDAAKNFNRQTGYQTALIGAASENSLKIAAEWCSYMKLTYGRFETVEKYNRQISTRCRMVILSPDVLSEDSAISLLTNLTERGINLIFTRLPEVSRIRESAALRHLLGIGNIVEDSCKVNGVTLFEHFLLGEKITFQKMKPTIPWYSLSAGTKVYMTGALKDQKDRKIKNEDLPPILWRNACDNAFVFAVNGSYLEDQTGLGFLTGMLYETSNYLLYPVVNAQTVYLQNYPYLSDENSEAMQKHYYYTAPGLYQNVLWPDIIAILNATGDVFNGMIAPQMDYQKELSLQTKKNLEFYTQHTEQVSGELGLSGDQIGNNPDDAEKLLQDQEYFSRTLPNYKFTVFSPGKMKESSYAPYLGNTQKNSILSNIRTLLCSHENIGKKPLFSFYNNTVLSITSTMDGFTHKGNDELLLRSLESALAFSNTELDFSRVLYPESDSDDWTKLSKDWARFQTTYWKEYTAVFDQLCITDTDTRVRNFLALNYITHRQSDKITLSIDSFHSGNSFLLRLHGEKVNSVSGGTFKQVEKDCYLIRADRRTLVIQVAADEKD